MTSTPLASIAQGQNATLQSIRTHLQSIADNPLPPRARKQLISELQGLMANYDRTLSTIAKGGTLPAEDGSLVSVPTPKSSHITQTVSDLNRHWQPVKEQLISLLRALSRPGIAEVRTLSEGLIGAFARNEDTFRRTNKQLVADIQAQSATQPLGLATKLLAAGSVALFLVAGLVAIFPLAKKPKTRKRTTTSHHAPAKLMSVLDGTMVLFDRDQIISSQFTEGAKQFFGTEQLEGAKLYELLSDILPSDLAPALNKYIELLFDDSKVESLITSLNPLVEFTAQNNASLGFRFRRLNDETGVTSILLQIEKRDMTTTPTPQTTEARFTDSNGGSLSVFDALLGVDGDILADFAHSTRHSLDRINATFKQPLDTDSPATPQLKSKGESILIEMHRLKGDFAALELSMLVDKAQDFENETRRLTARPTLVGDDFLPLTIKLDEFMAYADAFEKLLIKLGHHDVPTVETRADRWQHLKALSHKVAEDEGKQLELTATGLNEYPLNEEQRELINDICIQLIRNAAVHGIEKSDTRKAVGKPSVGRIDVSLTRVSSLQIELSIRDDGRGIDFEGIRQRAADRGLVSAEKLAAWSNKQLFNLLFRPEFSTARGSSAHAGQGVGLNVIRSRVKKVGGEIAVLTRKDRYSQFKVTLPVSVAADLEAENQDLSCAS